MATRLILALVYFGLFLLATAVAWLLIRSAVDTLRWVLGARGPEG